MRILDRYVVRNFLYSAILSFMILIALRVVVDLSLNLDEFVSPDASTQNKFQNIVRYYGYQSLTYITELGGIIIVFSAAFTLARMNHTNELTAMLASGVSLRRVVWPIVICAVLLDGLIIADQELLIPQIAGQLARKRDEVVEKNKMPVQMAGDSSHTVWLSPQLEPSKELMTTAIVTMRKQPRNGDPQAYAHEASVIGSQARWTQLDGRTGWLVSGQPPAMLLRATTDGAAVERNSPSTEHIWTYSSPQRIIDKLPSPPPNRAFNWDSYREVRDPDPTLGLTIWYDRFTPAPLEADKPREGTLTNPRFTFRSPGNQVLGVFTARCATWTPVEQSDYGCWTLEGGALFIPSDLQVNDLVLRQSSRYLDFMSSADLEQLIRGNKLRDPGAAVLARHVRFTEPINNVIMLLLALPFILSRERNIKASASLCLLMVATFYVFVYICRYVNLDPVLAAWLPILLFGPVAVLMLDSVKT